MKWSRLFKMISIISMVAFSSFAQTNKTYGVKGGFTLSNFWGGGMDVLNNSMKAVTTNTDEKNFKWFTVSLFSSNELIPDFASVQSELVYYRGGKSYKGDIAGSSTTINLYQDYLQMPFILKIHLPYPFEPSIYAGPQISWMFRSRVENIPATASSTPFFSGKSAAEIVGQVWDANTNVIDLGFVAGLDFSIPYGPGNIILDGRYSMGVLDVYNYAAANSVRNYVFMFMAGYAFNFGGSM